MAKSRFEYVKRFEISDECLRNCWIVVRIDGNNFHKFTTNHNFMKPNDNNALDLMTEAAKSVMKRFQEIVLSYGQSDEYSFVFKKKTKLFNRRASKISSVVVSQFSSSYTFNWSKYFPQQNLLYPPSFDSRIVLYPSDQNMRDYLSWRQADCHINNLFNTCYWCLVNSGIKPSEAGTKLSGTSSGEKNELLFSKFQINYNKLPEHYRKGTILLRKRNMEENDDQTIATQEDDTTIESLHVDIIGQEFWTKHNHLLT